MDFAAFNDWDWTAHAADDSEQTDDKSKGLGYSQLSGVIFLVDCGEGMLFKHNLGEESNFERCIKCIRSVCQKKVISSEKDMLAVVFYGMLDKEKSEDGKAIHVFQDLDQLNISRITGLDKILEDSVTYTDGFEKSDNYDMSDVLWACSNIFAKCNKTFGEKKILLFTDNDDPHKGDVSLERKTVAKATDLKAMGIELDILPMIYDWCGEKTDQAGSFDIKKFYSEILALYPDSDSNCMQPSEKFEDLLSRVYRKEHKRRALGRVSFQIGSSTELSVGIYCLCRKATNPTSVKIHQATNSEIRTQTKVFNAATGDDVMPQDIKLYQEYADRKILLEAEELAMVKKFDLSGLKLQGFKKRSEVKLHLHVKPSHFIYPDETTIKGSGTLFSALLSRCSARGMVAVCHYVPRSNSTLEIVYLLPQLEERDEQGNQTTPAGFHVILLPFKEDVREVPALEEEFPEANDEQVEKCKAVIKKLSFPYEPAQFENPALQKFYSNLEALALSRDEPDEIMDYTIPNSAKMDKKAGGEMDQFLESVWPDGYAPPTAAAKRPAAAASGAAKKAKVDPDNIDAKALALADKLGSLTVAVLKTVVRSENIHTTASKKADLIQAIKHHFGV